MIEYNNGGILIEPGDPMPPIPSQIDNLYLDCETTSRDKDKASFNPWHNCWPAGYALTWDNHRRSYYIPVGHAEGFQGKGNIDVGFVNEWLRHLFSISKRWVNHNIKYDAHVVYNDTGIDFKGPLVDTLTLAKIIDSDRMARGGYGLDALSKVWLNEDISEYEEAIKRYTVYSGDIEKQEGKKKGKKKSNKDYGRIPVDVMGAYACQDALTERRLWHHIDAACPADCREVWNTEIKLTSVLVKMERRGIKVDPTKLELEELRVTNRLVQLYEEISNLTGYYFNPCSSKQMYELLCQQHGLPELGWNNKKKKYEDDDEEGNPSFGKDILEKYLAFPQAPREVIKKSLEYRKLDKLNSGFIVPYRELNRGGIVHSSYNQAVRTGRLSCRAPNMQQLNLEAKGLFEPRDGKAFLLIDYSQIEFRLIVHYINDQRAIQAYRDNPRTDFHQWMAELCTIPRQAAKKMNFLIGYGGGKEKTKTALMGIDEIIELAQSRVQESIGRGILDEKYAMVEYNRLVEAISIMAYETYHNRLPSLKATSRKVAAMAAARCPKDVFIADRLGFVINIYGRRRHLPPTRFHIGFNSICQSSAADLMKERIVALDEELDGTGIDILHTVHDSVLLEGDKEALADPRTVNDICYLLEHPTVLNRLKVPILVDAEYSTISWADAKNHKCTVDTHEPIGGILAHLKNWC